MVGKSQIGAREWRLRAHAPPSQVHLVSDSPISLIDLFRTTRSADDDKMTDDDARRSDHWPDFNGHPRVCISLLIGRTRPGVVPIKLPYRATPPQISSTSAQTQVTDDNDERASEQNVKKLHDSSNNSRHCRGPLGLARFGEIDSSVNWLAKLRAGHLSTQSYCVQVCKHKSSH